MSPRAAARAVVDRCSHVTATESRDPVTDVEALTPVGACVACVADALAGHDDAVRRAVEAAVAYFSEEIDALDTYEQMQMVDAIVARVTRA